MQKGCRFDAWLPPKEALADARNFRETAPHQGRWVDATGWRSATLIQPGLGQATAVACLFQFCNSHHSHSQEPALFGT
jgi:hypothetical protein